MHLNPISVVLVFSMFLLANQASAEKLVTYDVSDLPKKTPKPYLKTDFTDNAYVYVTAEVNNADGSQCVFLNSSGMKGFFTDDFLDLAITAQPLGFFGVESSKVNPIASYTLNNKEKKCKSAWRSAIPIVPLSPFNIKNAATDPNNPSIILQFQSSASEELSIIEPMQGLLAVAGGVVTGGASTTVVGLTKITNDVLTDYFSKEFNNRRKNQTDATIPLDFTWADIASGNSGKKVRLLVAERDLFENFGNAINRIRADKNITPSIEFNISIETRRSAFFNESDFDNDGKLVSGIAASRYAILNYPKIPGVQSLYQRLNSAAPTNMQDLRDLKPQKCDLLFSTVRDLGFNAFDRALIADAALDEATSEKWRTNPDFYTNCLKTEPRIRGTLEAIYGNSYFKPAVNPPVLVETELAKNPPKYWTPAITKFLQQTRASLFSKGQYRVAKFPAQELLSWSARDLGNLEYFPLEETESIDTIRISDVLKKMEVIDAGCFFGWEIQTGDRPRGAMLVTTQSKQGIISQQVMDFEFDLPLVSTISKVAAFSMYKLDSPPASSYKYLIDNKIEFYSEASCKKKI